MINGIPMVQHPTVEELSEKPEWFPEQLWARLIQFGIPAAHKKALISFAGGDLGIPLCWVWKDKYTVQFDPMGINDGPFIMGVDGPNPELSSNILEKDGIHIRFFSDGTVARWFDANSGVVPASST